MKRFMAAIHVPLKKVTKNAEEALRGNDKRALITRKNKIFKGQR